MPNNVTLPGTGSVVEAVEVGGALRQVVQVANLPDTQPVTVDALPLPSGAATEATAAALLSAAQAIKTAAEALAGRTLDTSAISGTVALDSATLSALEGVNATVSGTVAVSNFPATQPVSGTVSVANLPDTQPVSAVALPLPAGAATEVTAAALLAAAKAIKTAAETLAGRTINTSSIGGTVAVSNFPAAEPITGTVAVSNMVAQGLTDTQLRAAAVPVTVENMSAGLTDAQLRAAPVPVAVAIVKNTDTPFSNGDPGLLMLAKRRDSDTTSVSADGDYTTLNMDETGRLKVSTLPGSTSPATGSITASAQTLFINTERASNLTVTMVATTLVGHNATFEYSNNSTNGTDGNWYGVQVVRSNANTVETATGVLAATPVYGWEASVTATSGSACVRPHTHRAQPLTFCSLGHMPPSQSLPRR